MTRSILLAALLATALSACSRYSVSPHTESVAAFAPGFTPYCGPIWLVDRQGYVAIPCPDGSVIDIIR